ncbi:hypothetical protein RI129_012272 [Pyrocoelia pectoralis]|uniref:TERF2-interacting telomeric protein 1 Myb domain-containing protein n=1 Tax=Pyrocoelia pectoralis TaxID=417401 RepID=A0AAN7UXH6_9COLE
MSGYKRPYTLKEEKEILKFIIAHSGFYQLRGRQFWVTMEESFGKGRTWQSLKEHFRKHMFSKVSNPLYELEKEQIEKIIDGYKNSASDSRKVNDNTSTYPAKDFNDYLSSDSD